MKEIKLTWGVEIEEKEAKILHDAENVLRRITSVIELENSEQKFVVGGTLDVVTACNQFLKVDEVLEKARAERETQKENGEESREDKDEDEIDRCR